MTRAVGGQLMTPDGLPELSAKTGRGDEAPDYTDCILAM
jgi:hypothetical protein